MRDLESGEKPLDMKLENALCYFLVDDGDKKGIFLASAYQNYILCQNNISLVFLFGKKELDEQMVPYNILFPWDMLSLN